MFVFFPKRFPIPLFMTFPLKLQKSSPIELISVRMESMSETQMLVTFENKKKSTNIHYKQLQMLGMSVIFG